MVRPSLAPTNFGARHRNQYEYDYSSYLFSRTTEIPNIKYIIDTHFCIFIYTEILIRALLEQREGGGTLCRFVRESHCCLIVHRRKRMKIINLIKGIHKYSSCQRNRNPV